MSESGPVWHPLCLSASVEPSTSAGARLYGKELVVWRDRSGEAHVWEDRCPHRGMKLSLGFVRGDHLACLYHGWQYDTAGQCRLIPAHPDLEVPATIAVPRFAVREWAGIVWTTLDPGSSEADTFEDIAVSPVRSIYVGMPAGEAFAAVQAFGLAAHATGEAASVRPASDNLLIMDAGADRLFLAFQPLGATRTGIHAVLKGEADAGRTRHYAAALEGLRHAIDASPEAAHG